MKVERQRYISQLGESVGPAALDVAEPQPSCPSSTAGRRSTPAGSARCPIIVKPSAGYSTVSVVIFVIESSEADDGTTVPAECLWAPSSEDAADNGFVDYRGLYVAGIVAPNGDDVLDGSALAVEQAVRLGGQAEGVKSGRMERNSLLFL